MDRSASIRADSWTLMPIRRRSSCICVGKDWTLTSLAPTPCTNAPIWLCRPASAKAGVAPVRKSVFSPLWACNSDRSASNPGRRWASCSNCSSCALASATGPLPLDQSTSGRIKPLHTCSSATARRPTATIRPGQRRGAKVEESDRQASGNCTGHRMGSDVEMLAAGLAAGHRRGKLHAGETTRLLE